MSFSNRQSMTTRSARIAFALAGVLGVAGMTAVATATPVTTGDISYTGVEGPFNNSGLAGTVPVNIALNGAGNTANNPAGPQAFASSDIAGGGIPYHQIVHLNDGSYGNSRSWIAGFGGENNININVTGVGTVSAGYAGIDERQLARINSFAFGSDNGNYLSGQTDPNVPSNGGDPNENSAGPDTGSYHDRTGGTYYIQYTTSATPSSAPDSSWSTLGSISLVDGSDDSYRHVYDLNTAVDATGLRLVVPGGDRIDEIEIYGVVPEPASLSLLGFGAMGLLARRRRV